jgi:phosphatidate phosphatase APP1
MSEQLEPVGKVHRFARFESRIHRWREKRARKRGRKPVVVPVPGYGGTTWVRVLGRALIVKPRKRTVDGEFTSVRGWRSYTGVPVAHASVRIEIGGEVHEITADRGGVIDEVIQVSLAAGWQEFTMSVEDQSPVVARAFVVGDDVEFGIISDIDDTVMVTALPRPLLAAWNSFVVDEHARQPVPGMAVLLAKLDAQHEGSPIIYLSTGAWNIVPTLNRFLSRHLFPRGSFLLTDWGPTHDRWFRSGKAHKLGNLDRLALEFPKVKWLLIGDDGQHDEAIYAEFEKQHPESVAAVAIRRLSAAEAILAGGRKHEDEPHEGGAPWVLAPDGAGLSEKLTELGMLH